MPHSETCDRILWYVSGNLEPAQAFRFEAHLLSCERCRLDAETFSSMMRSLRRQSLTDHVASEELVAYEEGELPAAGRRHRAVVRHLEACADCAEDFDALAKARRPAPRGAAMAAGLMVAGAALVVALFAIPWGGPAKAEPPGIVGITRTADFQAPLRSVDSSRVLAGAGRWIVTVTLPFGAPEGMWEMAVQDDEGQQLGGTTTAQSGAGRLHVLITAPASQGRYRLVARSIEAPGEPLTIYPFEVSSTPEVAAP